MPGYPTRHRATTKLHGVHLSRYTAAAELRLCALKNKIGVKILKEITIRVANAKKRNSGMNPGVYFQVLIDGVLQTHVKRFAIDLDNSKMNPKDLGDFRGVTYTLEKYLDQFDYLEPDSDKMRDHDEWLALTDGEKNLKAQKELDEKH